MRRAHLRQPGEDIGPWRIQAILGAGVESDVFKVRHADSGELRSLKLLRGRIAQGTAERIVAHYQQFRGLSAVKQIRGSGVLPHQPGVGDRPYLIFDYVAGQTLPELLARGRPKSPAALLLAVAEAVFQVHQAGLFIGDFDWGRNVLIERRSGHVIFCDLDCNLGGDPELDYRVDLDELREVCRMVCKAMSSAPPKALLAAFDAPNARGIVRRLRRLPPASMPQAP